MTFEKVWLTMRPLHRIYIWKGVTKTALLVTFRWIPTTKVWTPPSHHSLSLSCVPLFVKPSFSLFVPLRHLHLLPHYSLTNDWKPWKGWIMKVMRGDRCSKTFSCLKISFWIWSWFNLLGPTHPASTALSRHQHRNLSMLASLGCEWLFLSLVFDIDPKERQREREYWYDWKNWWKFQELLILSE